MINLIAAAIAHGGGFVILTTADISKAGGEPQTCGITFKPDGLLTFNADDASPTDEWWSKPGAGAGANYEVKAVLSAGGFTAEAAADGVWIAISSNRVWSVTETVAVSTETATATFSIRDLASQVVLGSASIKITANTI